jgi:ppGpp synthetase/RelA/SpoT-type nucleotidyltranferase
MGKRSGQSSTTDIVERELAAIFPIVATPGFWDMLHENAARLAREISVGDPWLNLPSELPRWRSSFGGDLLAGPSLPGFCAKSASSIRSKVLRKCQREPDKMPSAFVSDDQPVPNIGDLVRTRVTCRYLDGVDFFANNLAAYLKELGLKPQRKREGRIEGYFAQHVYFVTDQVFSVGGIKKIVPIRCEVQVATELATQMWNASHHLYESARDGDGAADMWQWDVDDPQFVAHQLGHMMHLADGLLVQLRRDAARKKK